MAKVDVLNLDGNKQGQIALPSEIFEQAIRADILSRVVEWQRSKQRAGTHHTKTISEISGTTKKMYKQKGTGRARHGSARAAQFRKGAVALGPRFRDHEYSIQKKVKDQALKMALSSKYGESKLVILSDLNIATHKTKDLLSKLSKLGVNSGLFIGVTDDNSNFVKAYRNIKHINALPVKGLNVLDILKHEHLLLTEDCVKALSERFEKL